MTDPSFGKTDATTPGSAPGLLFHEVQYFRQVWIWVLLLGGTLPPGLWFVISVLRQLLTGEPFGEHPGINLLLGGLALSAMLMMGGLLWFFYRFALTTRITEDAVHVGFSAMKPRRIAFDEIRSCAARVYRPVREYGGWGLRFGRHGRAMTVSGNRGVQLELGDGRRLLIGSQRAEEMAAIIHARLNYVQGFFASDAFDEASLY